MMRLWRRNAFRITGISELFSLMESIQRYGVFYIVSMSKHSKKQDFMRSGDDHSYGWANRQILHFSIQDFCLTSFFINIMVIEVDKTSIMKMLNAWLNKIPVTIYVFFFKYEALLSMIMKTHFIATCFNMERFTLTQITFFFLCVWLVLLQFHCLDRKLSHC